jgi:hypothetical protein
VRPKPYMRARLIYFYLIALMLPALLLLARSEWERLIRRVAKTSQLILMNMMEN